MTALGICSAVGADARLPRSGPPRGLPAEQPPRIVGRYEKLELTVPFEMFPDVGWTHWAFGEVSACARAEIALGYRDGTYQPQTPVDRAIMALFIARGMAGGDSKVPEPTTEPTFSDVPANHWAFKYIEYAAAQGVVMGYPDGAYAPDLQLDRGQMAVFIARAIADPTGEAGIADYVPPATPTFPDVTPDGKWGWCHKYVECIAGRGVAHGYPDGLYHPESVCSRDQMAVYVARAFSLPVVRPDPFDPDDISVVGVFLTPSGRDIVVPGFYYRPYQRTRDADGAEVLRPDGRGVFKIRFAGEEIGAHAYQIITTDAFGTRVAESGTFEVADLHSPGSRGYVRRSRRAPRYLAFDSGDPYFAIGENLCWPTAGGTHDYDRQMPKLRASGANWLRLWLAPDWSLLGLEHLARQPADGNGLGRYDQEAAWRVDYLLDLAHSLGIEVQVCLDTFHSLHSLGDCGRWDVSPYNSANGGPCVEPVDFFTNPEAKRLFRRRLRYLVARWGYATSVLAWEFWNEVETVPGYDSAVSAAWHQEMAAHLRSLDPWDHLITTSFARTEGDAAVDGLPELDFVQSHSYGSPDIAGTIAEVCRQKAQVYGKPHYFGELGADSTGMWNAADPDGIQLHNGLWPSLLAGAAGTAMLWWWDSYIELNDLYCHFAAVAAYALDVDWVQENYGPREVLAIRRAERAESLPRDTRRAAPPLAEDPAAPNLRALGLANSTSALLWVQNRDHTWWNHVRGLDPQPIDSSEIELGGFLPGDYEIEEWNTYTGAVTHTYLYSSTDGTIVVTTPSGLTTDVAYKIRAAAAPRWHAGSAAAW